MSDKSDSQEDLVLDPVQPSDPLENSHEGVEEQEPPVNLTDSERDTRDADEQTVDSEAQEEHEQPKSLGSPEVEQNVEEVVPAVPADQQEPTEIGVIEEIFESEEPTVETAKNPEIADQVEPEEVVEEVQEEQKSIKEPQSKKPEDSEVVVKMEETVVSSVEKLDLVEVHKDENSNKSESITSPTPSVKSTSNVSSTSMKTGMRIPTVVKRPPTTPIVPAVTPSTAPNSARTPATRPSLTPSGMRRHETPTRGMGAKSVSTKSIDNVGKFTPKVNAKYAGVTSKVASKTNHKPGGGNVEIFHDSKKYEAKSKVGSLDKAGYTPGGGNVKIEHRKLDFSSAKSKVSSQTDHKPGGGNVQILSEKLTWNAGSKVGSLDNAKHKPAGGNVQILSQKLAWKAESKVGSKNNIHHQPGGGNVKMSIAQSVVLKPAMVATMHKNRLQPRKSVSQRSSTTSILQKLYPGAVYPLTADQIMM